MTGERPRRLVPFAAALVVVGAAAWWWAGRESGAPRIEPGPSRATAERSVAAPSTIAPEVERSTEAAAAPPADSSTPSAVAAASPLLEPDRVVVVSGVVVAADGGAPIEGAELVVLGDILRGGSGEADTDEQGRYEVRLEGGVPARVRVEATAEGFSFGEALIAVDPDATELRADFRLRKWFEVAVEVVRALDGAPIAFASVELGLESWTHIEPDHSGETDAAGRWSAIGVGDLPRHGLAVVVLAEGFAPRRFGPLALPDDGDRLELRCEMSPPRPLTGIVVARGGGPIADADIELASLHDDFEDDGDETTSDERGRFTLDAGGIPEELATLLVRAEEWQTVRIDRPWSGGGEVTVVMTPPDPPWRGRVLDRASGRGVAGCEFIANPVPTASSEQFAESEEEGSFEASLQWLPHGFPLQVTIWADGYAGTTIDLVASDDGRLSGPSVIELERMLVIRGRVVDPSGAAELRNATISAHLDHAAAATVDVIGATEAFASHECEVRGKDGSYELEFPLSLARAAGRCSLVVEHDRRRFALGRLDLKAQLDRFVPGEPAVITLDLPIDMRPWWVREGK